MNIETMFVLDEYESSNQIEDMKNSLVEILKNFMPHEDKTKIIESSVGHIK